MSNSRANAANDFSHDTSETPNDQFFIDACMMGNLSIIEAFLDSGHDVNEFLITGWTLLLYASSYAQPNIIQYLLNFGADPNLHHEGYTPLMALCFSMRGSTEKRMKCLKYLIDANAEANAANKLKETPLMYACKMQEIEFIEVLLNYVEDINFADSEERTALFYAVANNRYDVTRLLIEKGADVTWLNYRGLNAFDIAVTKGHDKLIPLLDINLDEDQQEKVKTMNVSSWLDMFPTTNNLNNATIDSDVASILYGMGLESYKACFCGIDLDTFLRLREEDLEKLGIDISVHRKRFVDELLRFHKQEWSNNLMTFDSSEPFTPFEAVRVLGNINKQLCVMSSSIYFSKNLLDSIEEDEELYLTIEEKERLKNEISNIQVTALKIKDATNRIKSLAEIMKEQHSELSLPTYIEKKKKGSNHKWIIITIITITGICLFRLKSVKRLWNNEKMTAKNWRNIFNFSLSSVLCDKFHRISLFLQKGYQVL